MNLQDLYKIKQQYFDSNNKGSMQTDLTSEVSTKQLKGRQISQIYLNIEENTQPLTQLCRYNPKVKKIPLNWNAPIDLHCFFLLIVQTTYLLYSCFIHKAKMFVNLDLFVRMPSRGGEVKQMQEVFCQYILQLQYCAMTDNQKDDFASKFRMDKSQKSFVEYTCEYITKVKTQLNPVLQKHQKPDQKRQIQSLCQSINNCLYPERNTMNPKIFILYLEQSELFRKYSKLLKILNNSIFGSIRLSSQSPQIYSKIMEIQYRFLQKSKKSELNLNSNRVQNSIEESFKMLLKYHIISSEQSINQTVGSPETNIKPYVLGQIQGANNQTRKYSIKMSVREKQFQKISNHKKLNIITKKLTNPNFKIENQPKTKQEEQKGGKNQYLIDFYSGKNLLCIKYITEIELNIENTDILMFNCNYMTQNWNNVTLQFMQKKLGKTTRKDRFLVFKTISYLNYNEKVVFKILAMIDLLMVYAKITEQHLKKNIVNINDYYQLNNNLNQQCEHLKKMFICKIQKNYQIIAEAFEPSKQQMKKD